MRYGYGHDRVAPADRQPRSDEKAELTDELADVRRLTQAQREAMDRRLELYEHNPSDVVPWEQMVTD